MLLSQRSPTRDVARQETELNYHNLVFTRWYLVKKVFPHWYEWKEAGVRGIPSPFIKIYERGRDTPHASLWPSTTA
jgi:hypothetical protein